MIRLALLYVVIAALVGFWPFETSVLRSADWSPISASYDEGYEDGYEGVSPAAKSTEYLSGYDDGDFDAHCEWLKYSQQDRNQFHKDGCGDWDYY
ncbi:hypothetical protein V6X62_01635 [Spiribacter sp. 218]|uniref:hypothetical protein n=1 Tax=Spiribacter pallidus TaxID=1987936 RepID=UPI00349F4829